MKIYVVSTARHKDVAKCSLAQFSPTLRGNVEYVVYPEESMSYAKAFCDAKINVKSVLECPVRGIAAKREWIGQNCTDEKFVMLDDDMFFTRRVDTDGTKLQPCNADDIDMMFSHINEWLEKFSHVSISNRGGNNHLGTGSEHDLYAVNTRTTRVLAYKTQDFLSVEHNRIEFMEDFDVNLQLLERGLPNILLGWWAQDQKMTNAPGGCSTYRTLEKHENAARRLQELHPNVVALRQKKNKTGGEFGNRLEVTIQWKKAFKRS